jgi:hypothetical protein
MQNSATLDVAQMIRRPKPAHPHALWAFFLLNRVPQAFIAQSLGVSQMSVCRWLRDRDAVPPHRGKQLWELHAKILESEGNGK